jgi:hypothetical protein
VPNAVLSQVSPAIGFDLDYLAAFLADRQIGLGDPETADSRVTTRVSTTATCSAIRPTFVRVGAAQALNRRLSRSASRHTVQACPQLARLVGGRSGYSGQDRQRHPSSVISPRDDEADPRHSRRQAQAIGPETAQAVQT